jgi:hypothetical protein
MEPHSRSDPGHGSGPPRYPGTFLLAFREALAGLNWQARRWRGHVVDCSDAEGREHTVGLENLYRRARRGERAEWPALISEFLRSVLSTEVNEDLPTNLAAVADQLMVRLGQPLQPAPDEARVWMQPLPGTGLVVNLVVDYPNRMIYATEEMIAASGRSGAEWLEKALANLRSRTDADCFQPIHEDSGLLMCNVADAYDSSRALLLGALLPQGSADGWFVALPSRDQLLVLPVDDSALAFVHVMKIVSDRNYKSAPYPISDEVYWVHDGAWHVFRIKVEGEKVTLEPPPEFLDVLKRIMPPGAEADGDEPETET